MSKAYSVCDLATSCDFCTGEIECVCPCHADPQCDGVTNVLDVVTVVNVAFRGALAVIDPSCPEHDPGGRTDVDCSGVTDVLDVVKTVNVAFRGADPVNMFCYPCGYVPPGP